MDIILKDVSFEDLNYLRSVFVGKLVFYKSQINLLNKQIKSSTDEVEKSKLSNSLNVCRNDILFCERILNYL